MNSTKNTEISERISQVLKFHGVSKNKFAEELGYDRSQSIYDITKGKSNPSFDFFSKLFGSEYSEKINPVWLFTGNGEMLVRRSNNDLSDQDEASAVLMSIVNKEGLTPIPLVNTRAVGGFGSESFSIEKKDIKEYYVIPKFKYKKIDFMIEVAGESMSPRYNSGDVVACTIIKENRFIQWNRIHVIATKEQGIILKRVVPSINEDCFSLVADNPEYPPFDIPKDDITGLALVSGGVKLE